MKESFCHPLKGWFLKQKEEIKLLYYSIPAVVVALFVISVVTMNLLANKTIYENSWIAIDGGILVSWLSFLCMDVITKHFGPRASFKITIFAMFVNLLCCFIFWIVSIIPTVQDFSAFNMIFGGTWFVLLDSTIAFFLSGLVNIWLNFFVGFIFKKNPDGKLAFFVRSYVSTFIGQFADNLIFATLTFMAFAPIYWGFDWSFLQCVTCSILGAIIELVFEVIFSPFGYWVVKRWRRNDVGKSYIEFMEAHS